MAYAELFCQSNFSFLTGASHAEELVIQADFLHYHSLAITDECSVAGVVRAYTAIKEHQLTIKLIIGSLFWLNDECQVVLLCPTRPAYAELCRIITNARRRSEKGHYQLSEWDLMSAQHCLFLWLPQHKKRDQHWGVWLKKHHQDRLWIGVQRHLEENEHQYIEYCQQLAQQLLLPITACGGVLMHNATRLPLQHVLTAIKKNQALRNIQGSLLTNTERALRSENKLAKLFPQAWRQESIAIAERCQFQLDSLRYEYPSELVPDGYTAMNYLRHLVSKGKARRFPNGVPNDIQATIDKELSLIEELNYPYYFLTIHDMVSFAKQQKILYQGRGSAANSVVCYCLDITSVDPRQISVLFERFISKERNEPPDIDVDFEHERREEVIQYLYNKYGRERAAIAATVISYRFKSAVRDVGKALGIEESQLEFFIKNINRRDRAKGWQAQIVELGLQPDSLLGEQFISLVNEILGFPRHLSQHVGGFVISAGPLYEMVAIENAAMENRTIIQWDKDDIESLGLLKVDVLALGMLTAIRKCFDLVAHHYNRHLSIADITCLQDDMNVYHMIQQADTVGVFQIESRAQMSMLPRLKPACYYDLVVQIAIVRPGPIQGDMVHPYLKRRDGLEAITYPSEEVRSVLERTMGVPIFQEQVIKLAMVAAGFSGGEADQLRRAMASWKKTGELAKFKDKLIKGMESRGYSHEFAQTLYDQICGFGEYGFPESHSASFAVLAYCSAWLKYYYPEAFYTAFLNSLPMGFYSPSQLIQDAQRHQLTILPVCVNHSQYDHTIVPHLQGQAIQLGLRLVRSLSLQGATTLIDSRPKTGYQHINTIKSLGLNRKDIEALASANAMHNLANNRYVTRWEMMDTLSDLPLFRDVHEPAPNYTALPSDSDNLIEDYAALGLSLEHHPIPLLEKAGLLGRFVRQQDLIHKEHQSLVTVVGVVTGRQSPGTAGGVTFFTLEDDTGNINVVVWGATARAQKEVYLNAKILMVKGILEKQGSVCHVIAGRLIDLTPQLHTLQAPSRDFH
ncbi:DNA polymerase III subunit alpha [Vibrio sp. CAIM 722]|uniref:Error-prone DNA polymerase n=1 Tax=Vibrio eleionomae TaxID=2653505 RepID=A0A7X4LHT9_9VIBR|nr:error-prone DNA polymerase [Vibrio eleionomae]MZI92194.1 DNA polymerase III subunit alpha [Vibrio eleionomae]